MNLELKMKGSPCIRGLKQFKKGCPGKAWDGKEGCAAWHEDLVSIAADKNPEMRGFCIDVWRYFFLWWSQNRLAGVQQATETFRNGMLMEDPLNPGKAIPKLSALEKALLLRVGKVRSLLANERRNTG